MHVDRRVKVNFYEVLAAVSVEERLSFHWFGVFEREGEKIRHVVFGENLRRVTLFLRTLMGVITSSHIINICRASCAQGLCGSRVYPIYGPENPTDLKNHYEHS